MKKVLTLIVLLCISQWMQAQNVEKKPVKMAVAGIAHGHHTWLLNRKDNEDFQLVGIWEKDTAYAREVMLQYHLPASLFYSDLNKMLDEKKPQGVLAFGSTIEHLEVVEACAPKGIHVMMEKPMATTVKHAEKMIELSKKYNTYVLTNFETSWYPTTDKTFSLTRDTSFMGKIRKVVVHDGHEGPMEIGVQKKFFEWLTDPVKNGGGALMDFGCYGANLMTLLMNGEKPVSVTAVTQNFKPHIYSKVEDEATIIVSYPTAQCIIQASWNWPRSRKDMEVYGESGYAITYDNNHMKAKGKTSTEVNYDLTPAETKTYTDPFVYFADVIRGKTKIPPYGTYSMENNLMVVKILEAARTSAKEGKTIYFH